MRLKLASDILVIFLDLYCELISSSIQYFTAYVNRNCDSC